jgi:hypothetical protein
MDRNKIDNKLVLQKQDLTYLRWSKIRNLSSTAGSFLKSYSNIGGKKIYYKLSDYDTVKGVIGHECVNELIVDRLLTLLGIDHLYYQLIHAAILLNNKIEDIFLCASEDFKERYEDKIALDAYYENERLSDETPMQFCIRQGWDNYIYTMLIVDYLILNRDRHGANIEVLRDRKNHSIRLAPLFDHGLSLLCRCQSDIQIDIYDVMEDRRIQSFVGSHSAFENLKLIPHDRLPDLLPLKETHKATLLSGLESVIPENLRDKIWQMIWERWCYYEDLRNSQ